MLPHPGQRTVPRVWDQALGSAGRALGVAGGARTVDGRYIVLISAAMTRPLTPQPTTGTHMPGLVGPPPWHSTHMSSPRHTLCPVSAQVIITSPLVHPSFLLTVNLASLLQPRPSAFRAQFFTVVAPGGSGPPLAHLFPASVLCSGHTRHRHLRPPPLAGPEWSGLSRDGRLCSGTDNPTISVVHSVRSFLSGSVSNTSQLGGDARFHSVP